MTSSGDSRSLFWPHVGLFVIKVTIFVFDLLSLAVFVLIQKPWIAWRHRRQVFSKREDDDPSGPYTRTIHKINESIFEGIDTVDKMMRKTVTLHGSQPGFGSREAFGEEEEVQPDGKTFKKLILGDYKWLSFVEFDEKCTLVGRGLMSLGVRPRQNVCILADTRLEWMLAAQACFRNNIPVVTLYTTLGDDGLVHGLNETEITHLITTEELVPKIHKLLPALPSVTHVIYMECSHSKTRPSLDRHLRLVPFSQLEILGKTADAELHGECPDADDTAIIMYTSGSTGVPKAVIITHSNIVATARAFQTVITMMDSSCSYLAYLPLAHIFEISAEMACLAIGMRIGYSSPLTLTDKSTAIRTGDKGDASLVTPGLFCAVPLVLDRIRKSVLEMAETRGIFFKMFLKYAIAYKVVWQNWGFDTPILNLIVFNKIKALLGGKVMVCASGSAPLSADTHSFMKACLGCHLLQGYGLTETAAGATVMETTDMSVGRVGSPLYGSFIKLVDWPEAGYYVSDKPHPRGEILVGGATVTNGYYKNDALTRESFKEDGGKRWVYTGDVGEIFPDGTIKIIDRKKDIVKLQFGEYISLGKVEAELKTCPLVENVCVYGSSFHTYLIALVSPNEKALEQLAEKVLGQNAKNFDELCADQTVTKAVTDDIISHAKNCNLHKMEIPTKIKLCREPWLPDSGLVTAAMKIRRKMIANYYKEDIEKLYNIKSA